MTNRPVVSDARRRDLADLAEIVAASCSPHGRVEPALALHAEGVRVRYGDFGNAFDGLLERRASGFWAYVNVPRNGGRPDAPRARFTLAHEAGHYFIDEHRRALEAGQPPHKSFTDFVAYVHVEQEADLFAAHLLMPRDRFAKKHRRAPAGLAGVLALADSFGTSRTSTALRVAQLDLAPVAVVRFRPDGSAWASVSRSLRKLDLTSTIDHIGRIPPQGATDIVRRTESADVPIQTGATASFWFNRVRPGGPRDAVLLEEAVGLGPHGTLTFLSLADGMR